MLDRLTFFSIPNNAAREQIYNSIKHLPLRVEKQLAKRVRSVEE